MVDNIVVKMSKNARRKSKVFYTHYQKTTKNEPYAHKLQGSLWSSIYAVVTYLTDHLMPLANVFLKISGSAVNIFSPALSETSMVIRSIEH